MINDKIAMKIPPSNVTAHKGMPSKKPTFSTACTISGGTVAVPPPNDAILVIH